MWIASGSAPTAGPLTHSPLPVHIGMAVACDDTREIVAVGLMRRYSLASSVPTAPAPAMTRVLAARTLASNVPMKSARSDSVSCGSGHINLMVKPVHTASASYARLTEPLRVVTYSKQLGQDMCESQHWRRPK